jgi:hypothetical protein
MAIDKINTIDLIGIDNKTGDVILTISDHLSWNDQKNHLLLLQDKLNTYLRFIESGEIFQSYPKAKGKKITIEIVGKYELSKDAESFLEKAKPITEEVGVKLKYSLFSK